jgi:PAS domain S-box-containing protein
MFNNDPIELLRKWVIENKMLVTIFKKVFDNILDGILVVGENSSILFANKAVGEIFEYRPDELVGNKLNILIPERFRVIHDRYMDLYMEKPRERKMGDNLPLYGLTKGSKELELEIQLSPVDTFMGRFFIALIRERKGASTNE